MPTVNQTTGPGQPPAAPAHVQIKTSRLLPGPVQPTFMSLIDGQRGASTSAVLQRQAADLAVGRVHHTLPLPVWGPGHGQLAAALTDDHTEGQLKAAVPTHPVQEQGHPAAASADSQGKGQVLRMVPMQMPAAFSLHQLGNEALVSNAAKVEAAHPSQPAGSVQGNNATEAGGSVATAAPAEAETAGSKLHRGSAGSTGGAPPQSAALVSRHSSAPEAAQAAVAISSALEAALHNASGRDAEPHASSAALTGAVPAPAGAQAQGEATDEGDTAAAAAHAQDAAALAAAAAESPANAVSRVAPQVDHEQGTALHVAAEAAVQPAQAFVAQPAPTEGLGAGIDPPAAAAAPPHAMQAEAGAADPALPPPPMLPIDRLQASAAQAHIGASYADPAAASAALKPAALQAYHLAADCTVAAGKLAAAADALTAPAAVPGEVADPIAAAIGQAHPLAPTAQTASASKGWRPRVGQALTVTVVLPSLVALHVPVGCWAASVVGVAVCKKALSAW